MDEAERARRGLIFPITALHPDGQEEFKHANNEHVLICFLCGEEKTKELQESNNHDLMRSNNDSPRPPHMVPTLPPTSPTALEPYGTVSHFDTGLAVEKFVERYRHNKEKVLKRYNDQYTQLSSLLETEKDSFDKMFEEFEHVANEVKAVEDELDREGFSIPVGLPAGDMV